MDLTSTSQMLTALALVASGSGNSISYFIAVVEGMVYRGSYEERTTDRIKPF